MPARRPQQRNVRTVGIRILDGPTGKYGRTGNQNIGTSSHDERSRFNGNTAVNLYVN
jgi:hypothetical protein